MDDAAARAARTGGSGAQFGIGGSLATVGAMAAPNTFEGARLDRVTTRRRDRDWVAAQAADPASRAVVAGPDGVLADGDELALVPLDGLGEPLLLGVQDGGRVRGRR